MKFIRKNILSALLISGLLSPAAAVYAIAPQEVIGTTITRVHTFIEKAEALLVEFFDNNNKDPYTKHVAALGDAINEFETFKQEIPQIIKTLQEEGYTREAHVFTIFNKVAGALHTSLEDMHMTLNKFHPSRNNSLWQAMKKTILAKNIATDLSDFKKRFDTVLTTLNRTNGELHYLEQELDQLDPNQANIIRKMRRQIHVIITKKSEPFNTWMRILHRIKC